MLEHADAEAYRCRSMPSQSMPSWGMPILFSVQVRLQTRISAKTRLLYCTTGVLLRWLHSNPTLRGVSHVIIDEARHASS